MTKHFDLELDLGGRHMEDKDLDQLVAQLNDIWIYVWSSFQNPGNNEIQYSGLLDYLVDMDANIDLGLDSETMQVQELLY